MIFSLLFAASFAAVTANTVGFDPAVHCGASKASFGMSLNPVQVDGQKPQMRSLEAIAAIASSPNDIDGWIGWDDHAHPWIEFAPKGDRLKAAMNGKYVVFPKSDAVFAPLKADAFSPPAGYKLQACIFVVSQPS